MILKEKDPMILSIVNHFYMPYTYYKIILLLTIFVFTSCAVKKGDRIVLDKMIEGKSLLDKKQYNKAKKPLLFSAGEINKVWSKAEESKKVRQFWYEEGIKSFKGEPYERSLLFYYIGLLFLREKDYGNAQAAFSQSILQDAFAEDQKYRSDFAISYFLQALSLHFLGSEQRAKNILEDFIKLKKDVLEQDFKFGNTIFIFETGSAPKKITSGKNEEYIAYIKTSDEINSIKINSNQNTIATITKTEDIHWQAMTRGGRPIDAISKKKAIFKDVTKTTSKVSLEISKNLFHIGQTSKNDELAVFFLILGLGSAALTEATKTKADTRYWNNLPNSIYFLNLDLSEGEHFFEFTFLDAEENIYQSLEENIYIENNDLNFFRWTVR